MMPNLVADIMAACLRPGAGLAMVAILAACQETGNERRSGDRAPILAFALVDGGANAGAGVGASESGQNRSFEISGELTQGGWIRGRAPKGAISARLGDAELPLQGDGTFFAGFDRDANGEITLSAQFADGTELARQLQIAPRDWQIEHVNIARRPGGASEAFRKRRAPELEAIYLARQQSTGAQGWRQPFIWPVKGRISGRFGAQRVYRGEPGSYHSGMDITTGESGTIFVAPADGIVVLAAQDFSLEGNLLIIDHGQGLNSAFLHASRLLVGDGDMVRQGQPIGQIGASGRATGPHLHWSIKWNDARLDPLLFLPPAA